MEEKNLKEERTIGQKIKAWRAKKELTQEALARKADIPYTTLAKIESDVIKSPTLPTATKIAEGLGITLDQLIS